MTPTNIDTVHKGTGGLLDAAGERSAFFYFGFALLYLKTFIFETSLFDFPDSVDALLLASSFFFACHCLQRWREFDRPTCLLVIIFFFLVANYRLTTYTTQMTAFLFVVAASFGVDMKRFVQIWFKVTMFVFIALVTFYLIFYLAGSDLAKSVIRTEDGSYAVRLSFFFNHPNGAATVAMMLAGAMLYLRSDRKILFTHYASVCIASLFVLYTTDSRTSAILTLALIPLFHMYQKGLFERRSVKLFVAGLPIALFVAVYLLAGPLYSESVAPLFTGRVWLWHTTLINSGITVLGKTFVPTTAISYRGWESVASTLDCFYASGLLTMGLIVVALFCWAVIRAVFSAKGDEIAFLPLLIVLFIHGFTESGVLTAAFSFPIVFLSIALKPKEKDKISSEVVVADGE